MLIICNHIEIIFLNNYNKKVNEASLLVNEDCYFTLTLTSMCKTK